MLNNTCQLRFDVGDTTDNITYLFEYDDIGTYEHVCSGCNERDSLHTRCREKACRTQLYNENIKLIKEGYMHVGRYMTFKWWEF